jgi:hypothetical protein
MLSYLLLALLLTSLLLLVIWGYKMAVNLSPIGGVAGQFFDNNGDPLVGGKLFTYSAGTTTPQVTFTSATGVTPNSNPIILNGGGRVPSEIWLTDGLQYKFVLFSSTDQLIGSWDNIIGINSNFVNFVTSEEVQTATAGQTVFTLTTMQYQPGTNNLVVYVDGVNQIEGGTYSFVETSSTVVTFVAGLHVGALVKFVSAETLSTGVTSADLVSYQPAGVGAVTTNVQTKLRETVSVKDFGAVGDGVTDDTAAVHNALDYAIDNGKSLYFPNGRYRVTSGYTNSRPISVLTMYGDERRDNTTVLLDSASTSRFFYDFTGGVTHYLAVYGMSFECEQLVQDTDFFRFTSVATNVVSYRDVIFYRVNRPIVFKAGTYSDTCEFYNISFNDSGTIYSDSNVGSRGNLFTMIDVSKNGTTPDNTAKQVMNLQGFRGIQATNLLLQGALPSTGWTVLYLDNEYSPDWTQDNIIELNGYWSEWTTNAALYVVDQKGGRSLWNNPAFNTQTTASGTQNLIRLREQAQMQINNSSFVGDAFPGDTVNNMFSFEDINCHAVLDRCMVRYVLPKSDENFTFINCSQASDGSVANKPVTSALFGTQQSTVAFRWTGGYLPTDGGSIQYGSGTTGTPSVDSVYDRKFLLIPNVNNLDGIFYLKTRGVIKVGTQYNIVVRCKFPTFTGGTFTISPIELASAVSGGAGYDTTYSGQEVTLNISRRLATSVTDIGVRFFSSATGVSGNLEVYVVGMYVGNDSPRFEFLQSSNTLTTHATTTPLIGEWKRGDRIFNSLPTVGQPKSWVCTVAGTPGTWVSEGNL